MLAKVDFLIFKSRLDSTLTIGVKTHHVTVRIVWTIQGQTNCKRLLRKRRQLSQPILSRLHSYSVAGNTFTLRIAEGYRLSTLE